MEAMVSLPSDRRHRQRAATIEQLLDVAVDVMSENGVAGLSLGEVARRMGIRPPSIYVYFDSKNAVYDAVFERGWQLVLGRMLSVPGLMPEDDLLCALQAQADVFVRWCLEHPVHAQLMIWRPVPGFVPTAQAYEHAVAVLADARTRLSALQQRGLLRPEVPMDELLAPWVALIAGVITQQLANAPDKGFEDQDLTGLLRSLVAMYAGHYGAQPSTANNKGRS